MKNLCIITARGGSKRIPQKNIKDFLGLPIIAYSIQTALDSKLFDDVLVSTDCKEIAEVAKKYGASVPFLRSNKNSNDYATTSDALLEVIEKLNNQKIFPEIICCLYPTAPLLSVKTLKNSYDQFVVSKAPSLIPVVKFSFPPQRAFLLKDKLLEFAYPENKDTRSQDLEPIYHDAGQFYWMEAKTFIINKMIFSREGTTFFELNELEVQDIDSITDWRLAELKFKILNNL